MVRTEDQIQQDRGDLQYMVAQSRAGEDALAASAILELCRTIDDAATAIRDMPQRIDDAVKHAFHDVESAIRAMPRPKPTPAPATPPPTQLGATLLKTRTVVVALVLAFLLFTEPGRQIGELGLLGLASLLSGAMHH
jgi:hypothetical protein